MTEISSTWVVGSFTLASNATLTVNGNARTVDAGTRYLYDATPSRSWISELQTEIAAVVPDSTVFIGKDRKLRIVSGGGALTLAVPVALQAITGLPASPTVGTTIVADSISTLLWSPGWPETPNGHPVASDGWDVHDRIMTSSPSGLTVNVTTHHSQRLASWSWFAVKAARCWTSAKAPGEFVRFFDEVLVPGYRFKLYSDMAEDESSSTAVTWVTAYGPYVARDLNYQWYSRFEPTTDQLGSNIDLDALKTAEIS
jgi:hypothetical protein